MAVTLRSLCETASYLYGMRVIAGSGGMSNIVQWVHTVEDIEVSEFLHGGELIFFNRHSKPQSGLALALCKESNSKAGQRTCS